MVSELFRAQVERLYDQEREERNERRGLEQRAATLMGAVLVTVGLVVNVIGSDQFHATLPAMVFLVGAGVALFAGGVLVTLGLAGAHTNDEMSVRQAVFGHVADDAHRGDGRERGGANSTCDASTPDAAAVPKLGAVQRPVTVALEPYRLTLDYLEAMRSRVLRLVTANARMVVVLRLASIALGLGAYCALFGVTAGLIV